MRMRMRAVVVFTLAAGCASAPDKTDDDAPAEPFVPRWGDWEIELEHVTQGCSFDQSQTTIATLIEGEHSDAEVTLVNERYACNLTVKGKIDCFSRDSSSWADAERTIEGDFTDEQTWSFVMTFSKEDVDAFSGQVYSCQDIYNGEGIPVGG
jgi:hypothetical protein